MSLEDQIELKEGTPFRVYEAGMIKKTVENRFKHAKSSYIVELLNAGIESTTSDVNIKTSRKKVKVDFEPKTKFTKETLETILLSAYSSDDSSQTVELKQISNAIFASLASKPKEVIFEVVGDNKQNYEMKFDENLNPEIIETSKRFNRNSITVYKTKNKEEESEKHQSRGGEEITNDIYKLFNNSLDKNTKKKLLEAAKFSEIPISLNRKKVNKGTKFEDEDFGREYETNGTKYIFSMPNKKFRFQTIQRNLFFLNNNILIRKESRGSASQFSNVLIVNSDVSTNISGEIIQDEKYNTQIKAIEKFETKFQREYEEEIFARNSFDSHRKYLVYEYLRSKLSDSNENDILKISQQLKSEPLFKDLRSEEIYSLEYLIQKAKDGKVLSYDSSFDEITPKRRKLKKYFGISKEIPIIELSKDHKNIIRAFIEENLKQEGLEVVSLNDNYKIKLEEEKQLDTENYEKAMQNLKKYKYRSIGSIGLGGIAYGAYAFTPEIILAANYYIDNFTVWTGYATGFIGTIGAGVSSPGRKVIGNGKNKVGKGLEFLLDSTEKRVKKTIEYIKEKNEIRKQKIALKRGESLKLEQKLKEEKPQLDEESKKIVSDLGDIIMNYFREVDSRLCRLEENPLPSKKLFIVSKADSVIPNNTRIIRLNTNYPHFDSIKDSIKKTESNLPLYEVLREVVYFESVLTRKERNQKEKHQYNPWNVSRNVKLENFIAQNLLNEHKENLISKFFNDDDRFKAEFDRIPKKNKVDTLTEILSRTQDDADKNYILENWLSETHAPLLETAFTRVLSQKAELEEKTNKNNIEDSTDLYKRIKSQKLGDPYDYEEENRSYEFNVGKHLRMTVKRKKGDFNNF